MSGARNRPVVDGSTAGPALSRVVVVGGGIGGLAAALALARTGHEVVVLERAAAFAELGAGIQIAPNGLDALECLGLDASRACAVRMDELRFMDGVTGAHVASLPLTDGYQRRFGHPYVVVHRAELHTLLLDACREHPRVELRAGTRVRGYRQDGATATALLADGNAVTGDALIGADGVHSGVRRQLLDDGPPRISGITVYRAVIPMAQVADRLPGELPVDRAVTWWAGPHCHFVHYPIGGGRLLNLAASSDNGATEALSGVAVGKDAVRAAFAALGDTPQRLLELGEDWRSWVLVDRDPVDRWTDGRVALLGDAAHPMLHYAAQGACQALEDAVALGNLLAGPDDVPQCLEKYSAARRDRTAAIQLAARDSIRLWHPAGEAAVARNALLAALTPSELQDHVAWLHQPGERPGADPKGTAR